MKKGFVAIILILCFLLQGCGQIAGANFLAAKGTVLYKKGRYQEAVVALKEAIKVRKSHGSAHYYLALSYAKMGKKKEAIRGLEDYLEYTKKPNVWLSPIDKGIIPKCEDLLRKLKTGSEASQKMS